MSSIIVRTWYEIRMGSFIRPATEGYTCIQICIPIGGWTTPMQICVPVRKSNNFDIQSSPAAWPAIEHVITGGQFTLVLQHTPSYPHPNLYPWMGMMTPEYKT